MLANLNKVVCYITLFSFNFIYAQIENIPSNSEVYVYLKKMFIKGVISDYDDTVLPISRNLVRKYLHEVDVNRHELNATDQKILDQLNSKLGFFRTDSAVQLFEKFPKEFLSNITAEKEKHLYIYKDSAVNCYIDPILESKIIFSNTINKGSTLLKFGGKIRGNYADWLGFSVSAFNGIVGGDRNVALEDKLVEQSFTFNDTKINYFDYTDGYLRIEKSIMSLQLGRERILWGTGQLNKLILSENPPIFDFLRLNVSYKKLRYDFLHGWLVMKPEFIIVNNNVSKEKRSKYLAISRLGFMPNCDLSLGVSQMIIYSGRPFEAAYLNPFLFWESAQRSLNDLDNSFLVFDGRYRMIDGLVINASAIFDDINFGRLFKGEWNGNNNGFAWQVGISLTSPFFIDNTTFNLEYLQLRPYIFSHWGYKDALTYTNNAYLLGVDLDPNSTMFSAKIEHDISARIKVDFRLDYSLHGNNEYDSTGFRIRNVGGDVFEPYTINDALFAKLLDGVLETNYKYNFGVSWEFFNSFYFRLNFSANLNSLFPQKKSTSFYSSIRYDID